MSWWDSVYSFFAELVNPRTILEVGGIWLVGAVVFAETGLLVGFFLPGDSLLFTAGALVGSGQLTMSIWLALLIISAGAILGDSTGYYIGSRGGTALFKRQRGRWFFRESYVTMTRRYYERYGGMTLVIGRFLPIIRTFAPVLAGVIQMNYRRFLFYNVIGAVLWVFSLVLLGYWLGSQFREEVEQYFEYIVIGFIAVTTIPIVRMVIKLSRGDLADEPDDGNQQGPTPDNTSSGASSSSSSEDDADYNLDAIREKVKE